MPFAQKAEVEMQCLRLVGAVDAGDIPGIAAAAGKDGVFAGMAAYEAGVVPHHGQLAEELLYFLGLGKETFWTVGQMLDA